MVSVKTDLIRPDHQPWFKGYTGGTSNWLLDNPPKCFDWLFKERLKGHIPSNETALDMGSGNGRKTLLLSEAGIANVIGIDMVPEAIKMSQELVKHHQTNSHVEFVHSKILDYLKKIPDDSIHIITDTYVFTHQIPDKEGDRVEDYVAEYYRILVPGGLLALELFSADDKHFYGKKLDQVEPTHTPEGKFAFKRYQYEYNPKIEEAKGAESYHNMHNMHYTQDGIRWILKDKFKILRIETLPHSRHGHRRVLDVLARVTK